MSDASHSNDEATPGSEPTPPADPSVDQSADQSADETVESIDPTDSAEPSAEQPKKKRRRRRRRGRKGGGDGDKAEDQAPAHADSPGDAAQRPSSPPEKREPRSTDLKDHATAPSRTKTDGTMRAHDPELFDIERSFADLGLDESVVRGTDAAGFQHPTIIQSQLIPPALTGRDMLGQAKTGTGKTAAFSLPLLHLITPGKAFQALVLAPTRELAIQITKEIQDLGRFTPLTVVPVYGGQRIHIQADKLLKNPEIIVGTPGRIMDMVQRRLLDLSGIRIAILDEVDRMLDIGFREDIRKILRMCPGDRQTIMVSATIGQEIEDLAHRFMNDPQKIVTSSGSLTVKIVKQHYLTVEAWDKRHLLAHLLTHESPALTLVFCRLKRAVDQLVLFLEKKGIDAHAIHGDMRQTHRDRVMHKLRQGSLEVLIASDLASRGLDVEGITHVINYDLPEDPDIYVHRIGRTARVGREGVAWSFVTPAQGKLLSQIEDLINAEIPILEYPDFKASPRPENWRDETPGGRPPLEIPETDPARNRFAAPDLPAVVANKAKTDKALAQRLEQKFPQGIRPTKMPPNKMFGRVRTNRSNKRGF